MDGRGTPHSALSVLRILSVSACPQSSALVSPPGRFDDAAAAAAALNPWPGSDPDTAIVSPSRQSSGASSSNKLSAVGTWDLGKANANRVGVGVGVGG